MPLDGSGTPDTTKSCGGDPDAEPASECFLWNSGDEMLDQVQDPIIGLTSSATPPTQQRRVFYSRLDDAGRLAEVHGISSLHGTGDPQGSNHE